MRRSYRAAFGCSLALSLALVPLAAAGFDLPLRILAPAAPGTGWDQLGHAIEEAAIGSYSADHVEVTNVPGGGGKVGLAQFVRDPGPGEPLLVTGLAMVSSLAMNRSAIGLDQVTPIARLAAEHLMVVVSAQSAIESMAAFGEALRIDPGKVAWAGGPVGGVGHVAALLVARTVGADASRLVYIPYLGSADALAAVEEGRVAAAIIPYTDLEADPKSAPIRVLAVTGATRLPDVDAPTLREAGIDVEIVNWRGVAAPLGLSPERRQALSQAFEALSKTEQWQGALKRRRWSDAFLPSVPFASYLVSEQARVKDALKAAGLVRKAAD